MPQHNTRVVRGTERINYRLSRRDPTPSVPSSKSNKSNKSSSSAESKVSYFSDRENVCDPTRPTAMSTRDREMLEDWPKFEGAYSVLMIQTGDGGTFSYAKHASDDRSRRVLPVAPNTDVLEHEKVSLLSDNAPRAFFVGTKACQTCVAVYFEISNQRFFLAHINARTDVFSHLPRLCPRDSAAYDDIKYKICNRLKTHATAHGWKWQDVDRDSLMMACPTPEYSGHAGSRGRDQALPQRSFRPLPGH